VVDERAQAVALDRVVGAALLHVQHARGRGEAAEAAGLAVAQRGIDAEAGADVVLAAGEEGLVADRGVAGGHGVVVVGAGVAVHPEAVAVAGEARQRAAVLAFLARRVRVLDVVVVAVAGAAADVAADLVAAEDDAARVVRGAHQQAAALGAGAEQQRGLLGVAAAHRRVAAAVAHLATLEVLAQDDVDHAADGVGAVQRRGAVGQDLDPFHRRQRDGVEVGRGAGARRVRRAAAVDQHQGAVGADAAHVHLRHRLGAAARARAEAAERGEGAVAQQLGHRDVAAGVDRGAVDHGDRDRALDVGALEARAGDGDPVQGLCLAGGAFLCGDAAGGQGAGDAQRQRRQPRCGAWMVFHGCSPVR